MNGKKNPRSICSPGLAAPGPLGLWYSCPVGVGTPSPDFDPGRVGGDCLGRDVSPTESYLKGTPEYDAVLSEVRGLRFRRSVWNPIRQILPDQGVRKHSDDPDY